MKKQFLAVLALSTVLSGAVKADENVTARSPMQDYTPSQVSEDEIQDIFREMRTGWSSGGFCFNRAHVWAYEMRKEREIESMKILIHYTDLYKHVASAPYKIKTGWGWRGPYDKLNFQWEYHIAPAVERMEDGEVVVLDKAVANPQTGPKTADQWVNYFERRLEGVLNNEMHKVRARLAEYKEDGKAKRILAERIENLIANTPIDENGKYDVKCTPITHIVEHDTNRNNWCSRQLTSMYYFNQKDLRLLNYNSSRYITSMDQYKQRDADNGSRNYFTSFNTYTVLDAYKIGFGVSKRSLRNLEGEKVKDANDMERFPQGTGR